MIFFLFDILQGKYEDTIKECTKAIELNPSYMKALVRRGEAHEKLEHFEEAIAGKLWFSKHSYYHKLYYFTCSIASYLLLRPLDAPFSLSLLFFHLFLFFLAEDLKTILELDPSNEQAKRSIFRLEPKAAEKREQMKEEMIGKLRK